MCTTLDNLFFYFHPLFLLFNCFQSWEHGVEGMVKAKLKKIYTIVKKRVN